MTLHPRCGVEGPAMKAKEPMKEVQTVHPEDALKKA